MEEAARSPWGSKESDMTERLHFHFTTLSPEGSISSNSERTAQRRWRWEPGYLEVLQQRSGSLKGKRFLLIKGNPDISRNLALFYVWKDVRVWAHWNHSFDRHLTYLGPVSCVFTSWDSSGLNIGSGCSLMAARWQVFFSSWVPSRSISSPSLVTAITDDSDILCLLIRQEIFHFSCVGSFPLVCSSL